MSRKSDSSNIASRRKFLRGAAVAGAAMAAPTVRPAFEEGDTAELDLDAGWIVRNVRTSAAFTPARIPERLLKLMRGGGIFPLLEAEGLIAPRPQ